MSSEEPLHVATATNSAYLHWTATALLSAIRATPQRPLHLHVVVDDDVTAAERERLVSVADGSGAVVDLIALDHARLGELPEPVRNHGGAISCARFLLPDQLPDVERLVYLDADTLVVDSLDPLAGISLDGYGVGAVANVVEPRMRWHLDRLGVANRAYLNSGVLVLDLQWLRDHDLAAQLLALVRSRGETLLWVDQDALNLVLGTRWAQLHPRWNAQNSLWRWPDLAAEVFGPDDARAAVDAPAILHFEGPSLAKPWHYLCAHPYRTAYRQTAAATPWGPVRLDDRTVATRLIARLPQRWRIPAYVQLLAARSRFKPSR